MNEVEKAGRLVLGRKIFQGFKGGTVGMRDDGGEEVLKGIRSWHTLGLYIHVSF